MANPTGTIACRLQMEGVASTAKKKLGKGWDVGGKKDAVVATITDVEPNGFRHPAEISGVKKVDQATAQIDVVFPETMHTNTLIKRSVRELGNLGIGVPAASQKGDNPIRGFTVSGPGPDICFAATVLTLMAERAKRKVTITDHALTWFDFKQAIGVNDATNRGDKNAAAIVAWGDRIQVAIKKAELEQLKEKREKKVAAKPKKVAKAKAAKAKAKKGASTKAKKGAALAPSGFEDE